MEDQTNPQSIPISHKVVKFLTAATLGTGFLVLSGLILTGTVMALVLATPVFVIFSPILLPAAIAAFLAVSGFLLSGAFGLAAVSALAWIYNYLAGKHPPGADKLEYARMAIASSARDISERAKEYGHYVQSKAQEVAQMS